MPPTPLYPLHIYSNIKDVSNVNILFSNIFLSEHRASVLFYIISSCRDDLHSRFFYTSPHTWVKWFCLWLSHADKLSLLLIPLWNVLPFSPFKCRVLNLSSESIFCTQKIYSCFTMRLKLITPPLYTHKNMSTRIISNAFKTVKLN